MAKPSTIAVLPQPGSPIKIGLFFLLLDIICANLSISGSLPITGSSFPSLANLIRSREKLSKTGVFELTTSVLTFLFPPIFSLWSCDSIIC